MSNVAKTSMIQTQIERHREEILKGTLLAVDPSTGSGSSLPGFAWFEAGELKESGVIQVTIGAAKNKRLFEIRRTLQEEFPIPDVLVIEHISSVPWGNMRRNTEALAGLQRGVGAILSAFNVDAVIEVMPSLWKKTVDEHYTKSDEMDAIYIGRYVIARADNRFSKTKRKQKRGKK